MRVKVTSPATLPEVLKGLGVADVDLARVTAQVAKSAKLDATAPIPAGQELVVDDAFVAAAGTAAGVVDAVPLERPKQVPGKPLGALGLFGLRDALAQKSGDNPLGSLASLSAVDVAVGAARFLDKAVLDVRVPLSPGQHTIPLGGKSVVIDVPPGTVLSLKATVEPARAPQVGLAVSGVVMQFSKSVAVKNPADLSFVDGSFVGDMANAMVQVKLDGVSVDRAGNVTPKGTVSRPSLNLFKHVFGSGRSENSLETLVSLAGKPKLSTSVVDLSRGDVLKEKPVLAADDLPSHFDVTSLLASVGGLTSGGSFTLRLEGRNGFVDVGRGKATVVGADQKLSATVTGSFDVAKDGAIHVDAESTSKTPLAVSVHMGDDGAPGARIGSLAVRAKDGAMEVSVGGALLAAVRALADRFHVDIPPDIALGFDGNALVHGSATIRVEDGSVVVEDGAVRAVIDASGAHAKADTLDVSLGAGSSIELSATGIASRDGDVVVENAAAGFSATASGTASSGHLSAVLDETSASGAMKIDLANGSPVGAGGVRWSMKAKPKVIGIRVPGKARVEGEAKVVITNNAVAFGAESKLRLGLS